MLCEEGDRAAELIASGVGAANDHRVDHHQQFFGVKFVAIFFGRDQVGQQVFARVVAPLRDHLHRVLIQFAARRLDDVEFVKHVGVEHAENVFSPAGEQLPIFFWRTEQFTDDRNGIWLGDVGDDVGRARRCHRVD